MRRDTLLAFGVMILILAALAAKSVLLSVPPVPHAPGQFDAERAKARLAFVLGDQRPHPADSAADDAVRARLVATLRQMGLTPIVRDQFACNDFAKARLVACSRVRNAIAVLGPPAGSALLLSAHYDSVPVGPGASDDGIGVATLLEVGSILRNRPLRRPVILLFNEGEELGLVGARAFLTDPLSRNVDSMLNFEARGVSGPVTMFETNEPNGAAIAAYASAVSRPFASSLSTDVARLIPNDTDVTVFKERGWVTLNSAIMGNETRYHSPGDDLAGLDVRSLQDMGNEGLALATQLSAGVPRAHGTRIFFDLAQHAFIEMPLAIGVICMLFLLVAFAAVAWGRGALIRGTAVVIAALVAGGVLAWLAVTVVGFVRAGTFWRAHSEISFIALYATTLVGELAVLRTVGAKIEAQALRPVYWFVFMLVGGALALVAPGGIIYFLIPPAVVLLGVVLRRWYAPAEVIGAILGVVLLYLTWGELLSALEELFSPGPLWIVAPVAAIIIAAALIEASDLFARASRRPLLLGSAVIALIAWIVAGTAPAYSRDHQQRFTIEHLTDFPSGKSSWSILNDGTALPAAYERLGPWHRGKLDFSARERWLAAAPADPNIRPPSLQTLGTVRTAAGRSVRLRLKTNDAERVYLIAPEQAHIRAAGVAGFARRIAADGSSGKFTISCTGRSCDGAELTVELDGTEPVKFTIFSARNGLPQSAAPLVQARPRFARPQYVPDETLAMAHVTL
jgi:hypothetical protein